ncbi:dynein heavy chain 11, axonemal [Chanos chanos]|uniref:Dynein heavy chain 11, axonemal n=1 Tax=Chanos chanos TaxID=29144 RepID=A0A6J2W2S6_CHACN|nr:dynein heavy chain 11, axonemal-like [Chanos chanos]
MDHAPVFISQVLVSVLANPLNQRDWPRVVGQDMRRHLEQLRSRAVTLKGRAESRTLLSLPLCVETADQQQLRCQQHTGCLMDRALLYSIETMVIQWTQQMGSVLQRDSSMPLRKGDHPGPSTELHFWAQQKDNLLGIQRQLQNPKVDQVLEILRRINSSYYASFIHIIDKVNQAVVEAEDIELYLRPLRKPIVMFEERTFTQLEPLIPSLFHTLALIWTHSRFYCSPQRIVTLLTEFCNLLIEKAFVYLIPEELFKMELEEGVERVQRAIQVFSTFKCSFQQHRDKLTPAGPYSRPGHVVKPWDFPSELVLRRIDRIMERLTMIEELFASALDFLKLERLELGGSRGKVLSEMVYSMNDEFHDSWRILRESKYDPLDYTKEEFVCDYKRFMEQNRDFDQRLGTVLNLAFQHSPSLESAFKLLQIFGTLLERPRVHELFAPNYILLLGMFQEEVGFCQHILDTQREKLRNGCVVLSKNMPMVAGNLKWSQELRDRILTNRSNLCQLTHIPLDSPEAEQVLRGCESVLEVLDQLDEEVYSNWSTGLDELCHTHLNEHLLSLDQESGLYSLNFHPALTSVLREAKYLGLLKNDHIPKAAQHLYSRRETLYMVGVLEKPLEKRAGRNFAPPGTKKLIYFVDDLNMPEVDAYGTVQPHTLIRQHLDYSHWYDRQRLVLKEIHNCQYITCMNPTAGSFSVNPRLQRHFSVFAVHFPGAEALNTIYSSILTAHFQQGGYSYGVSRSVGTLVQAAICLHQKMTQNFLPTAIRFHYIFNLRDMSNIFQGILFAPPDSVRYPVDLVHLWLHECSRVYSDKLMEEKDVELFNKILLDTGKRYFECIDESILIHQPLLYSHFAHGAGEPRYAQVSDWEKLQKTLTDVLEHYNELHANMNLVLFEEAMQHICRISRILEAPLGNALLIGVGGSGKQSLCRLAAFLSTLEVFQITLRKGYGISDLRSDIAALYIKVGVKNIGTVFLHTDAQIPDERFLVLINDMLASGDIPDLFSEEEIDVIVTSIRLELRGLGLLDTRENCWNFFIERIRRQLKVVLCFSPVGFTLRTRARKFPALVNCTAIDWFHAWPQHALQSVSSTFINGITGLEPAVKTSISEFISYAHTSVNEVSVKYQQNEKHFNYTTPKSFLEFMKLYGNLLGTKRRELTQKMERLENGLQKLQSTASQVEDLKAKLAIQEVELHQRNSDTEALISKIGQQTEKLNLEKSIADAEEQRVAAIQAEVTKQQQESEEDLAKAEPALQAANAALNTLNRLNLTELRTFPNPPAIVTNVSAAVLVLLAPNGRIPKDRSWKAGKVVMSKVDDFLQALVNFDKEHIPEATVRVVKEEYLRDPEFNPDFVRLKSSAAAGLCAWVINIIRFHEVGCEVEVKKMCLTQANADLVEAAEKLEVIRKKLAELDSSLDTLTAAFERATSEKLRCQDEVNRTNKTIELANRLVKGLESENVRWAHSVAQYREQEETLCGDVLLTAAFISYSGSFSKRYRHELLHNLWMPYLRSQKVPIPMTEGLDPVSMLTDDATVAKWNNEGLPGDKMSTENATILTNCERWPLLIDPQLQGIKWLKSHYGNSLKVVNLGQKGYVDVIEQAVVTGEPVLIENLEETIDPVIDPLLGRHTIKKGRCIKVGDKECFFHPDFRLILHTKLANPHYKPEIQAQTTLINFTVTRDGLEDQLLAEVVNLERPDLEHLKSDLTKQQNTFKIELKQLEDELLTRLSAAESNFLGDNVLVEKLETTKHTAAEIEMKVLEAKVNEVKINEAREHYRPVAVRASLLYFIINDLNKINPMYQFSLKAFNVVFHKAVNNADSCPDVHTRVNTLINCITFSTFNYINRGLFERDKLTFTAQLAFQLLLMSKEINARELDFLLRFNVDHSYVSPVDYLSNSAWSAIKTMSFTDEFRGLDRDIEGSPKRWKKVVESECPEKEKLPQEWKGKSSLQKLILMRALRPDRMTYAVRNFVEEKLGVQYTEGRKMDFAKLFKESGPASPVFFILSPGVDPLKDVESLGKKLGFTIDLGKLHNVSLGQGQEAVAELAMEKASKEGHWVILQNIHLVAKWLGSLEKLLERCCEDSHPDYRVFMSAEPSPTPQEHIIPQGILENSIKITNEPPTGMLANLHAALDNFDQDILDQCSREQEFKTILFSLCYFHACVAERRKFGPQGWNRKYPFNTGDLTISVNVLYNYLEANSQVPWEDLRYLFGEIMYGGHITDDWDRRLCRTYLEEYMQPNQFDRKLSLAPGFVVPSNLDYQGYHGYIDEMLPHESPVHYGLHPNAEIEFLTVTSDNLFHTLLELQSRDSAMGEGASQTTEEKVKTVLDDILEKLPEEYNMSDITSKTAERSPYVLVCFQECERMNSLISEMRRSLKELDLGLKGELAISSEMEQIQTALFFDNVPDTWTRLAYPSTYSLAQWYNDLLLRCRELDSWTQDLSLPSVVWLSGLFNPQSFLTAVMQSLARKNEWPLDKMNLTVDVTKKFKEEFNQPAREGAYVHGLYMEGARWDIQGGTIAEARLKELTPSMPVIAVRAVPNDRQETRNIFECPVYKTKLRANTYVWTFSLKTRERPAKWILAGVALLLSV